MKKILLCFVLIFAALFLTYKILSAIPKTPIDKSVTLVPPSSSKSAPEHYAFGYNPVHRYSEAREACAEQFPNKKAMFGDLHIHTAISADAFPDGTRTFPEDVYRFAKGSPIDVPRQAGSPRTMQLARPLDFAAVTDHAETFGEGYICRNEGEFPGYDSKACQKFRSGGEAGVRVFMIQNAYIQPSRRADVCGENLADCTEADRRVWQRTIKAAQDAYDRSAACTFTSFVGYEYTRAPNAMHLHRNTIYKNASVPSQAFSHQSHPFAYELLEELESECRNAIENCDVISIPHNPNISGGNAFNPRELEGFSPDTENAYRRYRNAYDRLMEITQHKGSSECLNGVSDILGDTDELCDIEALRKFGQDVRAVYSNMILPKISDSNSSECSDDSFESKHNLHTGFCLSSNDYARGALLSGMQIERGGDANPFEFGFIGSSDTHIGAAGATEEADWGGHIAYETDLKGRLGEAGLGRFNRLVSNPGGLAGVYARENSRDAIFQSMKRREAFATSGPRIEPRFFAGNFDEDICAQDNWLSKAYANGTPMGSKLSAHGGEVSFIVQAKRDPLSKPLQKIQIIKGWVDARGQKHNKVIDLADNPGKADALCARFVDTDYEPAFPTYYYMRATEPPSARWSHLQCEALPKGSRPPGCDNDQPDTIAEMAWSSPIWFTPGHKSPLPANPGAEN